jgi:N-acetylglucosaminyldiphosphoundecaprenol N-acetyl-beta-D-mannosaminyltransferase
VYKIERIRVLGVPVDIIDMSSALNYIDNRVKQNSTGNYILAINPEKVNVLQKNPFLKRTFDNASLLLPDGIGIVLATRMLYGKKIPRVPGADLMQNLCKEASFHGYRVYIYGSKEEVNKKAVDKLIDTYPGIKIVGRCNGYLDKNKMDELINEINNSLADILFISLGSPKQEIWIQEYLPRLKVKICQGIGGTLDTIAGDVKRAPVFFRKAGLEWFYRLLMEPKRFRRQLVLPVFAAKVLKEKLVK